MTQLEEKQARARAMEEYRIEGEVYQMFPDAMMVVVCMSDDGTRFVQVWSGAPTRPAEAPTQFEGMPICWTGNCQWME